MQLRLQCYKRIANSKTQAELDEIRTEMIDRFGLLPSSLKNLFALAELKQKAAALGVIKIEANEQGGKFEFNEKPNIKPETLIHLIQNQSQHFRLNGPSTLKFIFDKHIPDDRIKLVDHLLDLLNK